MGRLHRAVVAAGAAIALVLAGGVAAQAATAPSLGFTITLTNGATTTSVDQARYHGSVTGVAASTAIQVQRRTAAGTWRTVTTARTGAHGAYAGSFQASGLGRTAFRAHVPATKAHAAASSPSRTVTVSKFFLLDEVPTSQLDDGVTLGPVTLNGNTLPHAMTMDGAASKHGILSARWALGGHCSRVVAFVTPLTKGTGLLAHAAVFSGTDPISNSAVIDNGDTDISTPIGGVGTLRLVTEIITAGTGSQKVLWLDPAVLCTVDPRSL